MKAGFYQFNPSFGKKEENIGKMISAIGNTEINLLVLPEFFATGYQFTHCSEVAQLAEPVPDGYTTRTLSLLSRKKNMYIAAGLPEMHEDKFFGVFFAVLQGPVG